MTKKLLMALTVCFYIMAINKAWEQQYERADSAETDRNSFSNSVVRLQNRCDNLSDTLLKSFATNKAQAATIAAQISSNSTQSPQIQGNGNPINYGVQSSNQQGGIAANSVEVAGDLILQGKRPIESISIAVTLESDTASNQVDVALWSDSGVGVIAALLPDHAPFIRFEATDRDIQFGQISQNKRVLKCFFRPENPTDILGKDIDFLKTVHRFAVRFSDFQEVHAWPAGERRRMKFAITINGIESQVSTFMDIPTDWNINDTNGWTFTTVAFFEQAADNYKRSIMQVK
jgi:hypothetical protein